MTLRQLLAMHRGKCRDAWGQAALVAAMLANCHRDPKKRRRPYEPSEFNPYAEKKERSGRMPITKSTIQMLKVLV